MSAEKLSQSQIDDIVAAQRKKDLSGTESPPADTLYICAYCKKIFRVKYKGVPAAPMLFLKPDANGCAHWLVAESCLKSRQRA